MSVRIYVEGGGDQSSTLLRCRAGFSAFFAQTVRAGHMPKVIACGSRNSAYDDFCTALRLHPMDTIVLLVDSEEAPLGNNCWTHLKKRDEWEQPERAHNDSVFLMVRCMEAWFMADKEALRRFYGQHFLIDSLPQRPDIEAIPKADLEAKLKHATSPTGRPYHKTQHGFDILASLNPALVASASPHAKRLVDYLQAL